MSETTAATTPPRPRKSERVDRPDEGISITVYPLGARVMDQNPMPVSSLLAAAVFVAEQWKTIQKSPDVIRAVWAVLSPVCGRDVMRLASACCVPNPIEIDAPVDVMGDVVLKWIRLSFTPIDPKLKNFVTAADETVQAAADAKLNLWKTLLSNLLRPASTAPTSSVAPATTAPPTPAGPGPSSGPTLPRPVESNVAAFAT